MNSLLLLLIQPSAYPRITQIVCISLVKEEKKTETIDANYDRLSRDSIIFGVDALLQSECFEHECKLRLTSVIHNGMVHLEYYNVDSMGKRNDVIQLFR